MTKAERELLISVAQSVRILLVSELGHRHREPGELVEQSVRRLDYAINDVRTESSK